MNPDLLLCKDTPCGTSTVNEIREWAADPGLSGRLVGAIRVLLERIDQLETTDAESEDQTC
jgi:hypothetical protein